MELGTGLPYLGAVMWACLDQCHTNNDVRSAKTMMILSQVWDIYCAYYTTEQRFPSKLFDVWIRYLRRLFID